MTIKTKRKSILSQFITVSDLLKELPRSVLKKILSCQVREFLPSGEILFEQGDMSRDIFIVAAGRLHYEREENGKVIAKGEFNKSDLLGELSIFTGEPRSATVIAVRDSELIRIPSELARDIFSHNPQALLQITKIIAERLSGRNGKKILSIRPPSSFCIFPCSKEMEMISFLEALVAILNQEGRVKVVNRLDFESIFDPNVKLKKTEKEHKILEWFQELELENDYLFYIGDYEDTDWSSRCVRQSDRILLLQDTSLPFSKSPSEINLLQEKQQFKSVDLILLHKDHKKLPENTLSYLSDRHITRHYHVALTNPSTIERMSRRLIGNSLGLALGGGGAKAFAHLGVLRGLEENHLEVDMVSGTSAGSVFAALISMGYDSKSAEKKSKELWVDKDLLSEYTIPIISLVSGKKYTEAIKDFFGEIKIEDLWIPYFAVSTDLTNSRTIIHDSGFLWKAIRASTSLPGIVPPFVEDNIMYVDGGLMDNVPGIILKERGAGKVICVDVFDGINTLQDKSINAYFEQASPGILSNPFLQLGSFLKFQNLLKPNFPPIGEILIRSMLVASRERLHRTEKEADLFLKIPTADYGVLDWSSFSKLIPLGYNSSIKSIQDFRESRS